MIWGFVFLSVFVAKKQNIRYGTNNATKTLRFTKEGVLYISKRGSLEHRWWKLGTKMRLIEITRKQLKTVSLFNSLSRNFGRDLEGQ